MEPQTEFLAPSIHAVGPLPQWAAGENVGIYGKNFVAPNVGITMLRFRGEFTPTGGAPQDVDMEVRGGYRMGGMVEFTFEPAAPPAGFGMVTGTFDGDVTATNVADEMSSEESEPFGVVITIGPSIIITSLKPDTGSCSNPRVTKTLSGTTMTAQVKAIGLAPATSSRPQSFQLNYLDVLGEVQEDFRQITTGDTAALDVELGALPIGNLGSSVFLNFIAEDGFGTTVERSLAVDVGRDLTVRYDGNVRPVEMLAPMLVSGCIPGGPFGRATSYSEGTSESRTRSISYSVNLSVSLWVVNAGFGMTIGESVTSGTSTSLGSSGFVLPNRFGVWYRQTQRLERVGQVVRRDICGSEMVASEARVTDWTWAPDLAITAVGAGCPPAPPSNLPPAQVFD